MQSGALIKEFVDAHIIPPEVVKHYTPHRWHLNIMKAIRAKDKSEKKKEKKKRQYEDYNWEELCILQVAWISFWLRI